MTSVERLNYFSQGQIINSTVDIKDDIKEVLEERKIQEQYAKKLEADNEKLRQIVTILCDTIDQLI